MSTFILSDESKTSTKQALQQSYFMYSYSMCANILNYWKYGMWKDSCVFARYNKVLFQAMFGFVHVAVANIV